ncbi:hypothetical protein [Rhodopirellula bahusiensis]|uniref:Uncharacterized protein n=1 Tax=Rhodopirellula bahusiensis TaxID=2014065 RepID=A0A2G1W2T0_9BACT|nr:hypothetical protein [Rhodopirellula bahusiensis]PHQ33336.1 hypothetical protein CEE69_21080 [Rhodopirellula bahusiensis]
MSDRLVEIGVIVAGSLDEVDEAAVRRALGQFREFVTSRFPDFRWEITSSRRPEAVASNRTAPSALLQQALEERDEQHWDFAFAITAAELESHYSHHCFAALSRPLDSAVFSLSLIDPRAIGRAAESEERIATIAKRLSRLMLHAVAHLLGLARDSSPNNLLFHPTSAEQLDAMEELTESQVERHNAALKEIADQRLEEQTGNPTTSLGFMLRSAVINAREIWQAIGAARPWEFPRRLSGLTLAAVSTLVVLLLTAESWDLALSQNNFSTSVLVLLSWVGTTTYVVFRQQLIIPNRTRQSEQMVVTNLSAIGIVFAGMLVTWLALTAAALAIASLLFGPNLIAEWASSLSQPASEIGWMERFQMSTFSASLGLMIGALGTSFESQHYFRHIIFVDEEI